MYTFKTLIYILISLSLVAAREIRPRVIGGVEDVGREFPFAVMIQLSKPPMYRTCSGSLIALSWVLSAAHCTPDGPPGRPMRVKYGDTTLPSNETKFYAKVIKGIPHPGFKLSVMNRQMNDIGLLKIERISNTPTAKLSAVDYRAMMGLPIKYAGFGRSKLLVKGEVIDENHMNHNDIDPPLLVGEAVIISCKPEHEMLAPNPAICLAPRCGPRQSAYYGDSGGPLLLLGRIIGVTSMGLNGGITPLVAYTPVSPYLEWINDTIHSD